MMMKLASLFSILLLLAPMAGAQNRPVTPKPGSPERKAILDTLRAVVRKELNQPVVFKVDHLKVYRGWAFLRGVPQKPDGKPVDYRGTRYEEAINEGAFDDWVCALFEKRNGQWALVAYVLGATDVPYEGWDEEYKAPKEIFEE